jgi:hypothetical protein
MEDRNRSGQARTGQDRSGQIRSDQDRSDQDRSVQVRTSGQGPRIYVQNIGDRSILACKGQDRS